MTSSSSNSITIPSAPQRITLQHGQPTPEMSSFSQRHGQTVSSHYSSFWWPELIIFRRKRTSGDKMSEPHLEPEVFRALRSLSLVNMCPQRPESTRSLECVSRATELDSSNQFVSDNTHTSPKIPKHIILLSLTYAQNAPNLTQRTNNNLQQFHSAFSNSVATPLQTPSIFTIQARRKPSLLQ